MPIGLLQLPATGRLIQALRRLQWCELSEVLMIAAVALSCLAPAVATADCAIPEGYRSDVRPDPEGTITVVTLGVLVADVTAISDVDQTIEGDYIVRKRWRDGRLANQSGCRFQRSVVWFPVTDVLNSNQLRRARGQFAADQVSIGPDGQVEYYQRFFGPIATYHQLQRFPFDRHHMRLRLATLETPATQLKIELDQEFTGLGDLLNIPDWMIEGVEAQVIEETVPEFHAVYSVAIIDIICKRNSAFYVYKVLVPLTLIVLMSFVVFWINPERFGPQIGLSATAMLTLIAFQFALTTILPKLGYFTVMDKLILGSTGLVFAALVEATATSVLVDRQHSDIALKCDRVCRWLFPLMLIALWLFALA